MIKTHKYTYLHKKTHYQGSWMPKFELASSRMHMHKYSWIHLLTHTHTKRHDTESFVLRHHILCSVSNSKLNADKLLYMPIHCSHDFMIFFFSSQARCHNHHERQRPCWSDGREAEPTEGLLPRKVEDKGKHGLGHEVTRIPKRYQTAQGQALGFRCLFLPLTLFFLFLF